LAATPPPVQALGIALTTYFALEKAIVENVDQGNGVCFFWPWTFLYFGLVLGIIPSSRPVPPGLQQHVNFIGQGGIVYELVWKDAAGQWACTDLMQAASTGVTAVAGSPLGGYSTPGQQHVNFIGDGGIVYELVWKDAAGQWACTDLMQAASTGVTAVAGSPLDGYST
jgi:uncharacterized membrane protein YccF (DUF307 family)